MKNERTDIKNEFFLIIELNVNEALENIQLRKMLKFNPQDTIDEANALAANFNDVDLHIFNTPEELPAEILTQIEHDGIDQNRSNSVSA